MDKGPRNHGMVLPVGANRPADYHHPKEGIWNERALADEMYSRG